jgi:hypothetical protein
MDRARIRVALLATLPMMLMGCEHAVIGNVMALGMTCCLFFGTLQLGRRPTPPDRKRTATSSSAPK